MRGALAELVTVGYGRQVWLLTVAHGVNEFYSVALPPVIPLLVADLNVTYGQAGALITVYFVMYSIFQLPAGFLGDRVGRVWLLSGGMILMSVGLFVVATAGSYHAMIAGQVVAGIGGSTYHPSGMSFISDLESAETEGRAMGIHGFGGVAGMALAPALIGGVATVYDWRIALQAAVPIGLVYAVAFPFLFVVPKSAPSRERDARPESISRGDVHDRFQSLTKVPLAWWVVGLFAINFLVSFEIGSIRTFAPTYLFTRFSDSAVLANGIYFVMLVGAGVASIAGGNLADRIDRTIGGGLILGCSGVLLAATAAIPAVPIVMLAWFFVLGAVTYSVSPVKNALTSAYSEREYSSSLFGLMLTASALGGAVAPYLLGVTAERTGWLLTFPGIAIVGFLGALLFVSFDRL